MTFFQFEMDFVESLRCIPMQVRYKLDACGIKLTLTHWHQLSYSQRQQLVDLPIEATTEIQQYQNLLQNWILSQTGEMAAALPVEKQDAWVDAVTPGSIPESVRSQATDVGVVLSQSQWELLTPLQRFALIKLSRSGHENRNFLPALKEFKVS